MNSNSHPPTFALLNKAVEAMASALSDAEIEQVKSMMNRIGMSLAGNPPGPAGNPQQAGVQAPAFLVGVRALR